MSFSFLQIIRAPSRKILELLENNIIGTPGQSMLYQHRRVEEKIYKIADPYFVCLIKRNSILGTCCFCRRITLNEGKPIVSFYIRYFSFQEAYRRKKITAGSGQKISLIRTEVINLLNGANLDVHGIPFFHYAYVDPRNERSKQLCNEFGFEKVRTYTTVMFNRLTPKNIPIVKIEKHEEEIVRKILLHFYDGYTMFSFENLFQKTDYYVVKDESGRIVAGAQANLDHWKIHSLPGKWGHLLLSFFSNTFFLKRILNKDYHFIALDGIFYEPGFESALEVLFEGLLYNYKVNSALVVVDDHSPLYRVLKSLKLGWVARLSKEVKGDVIIKFVNFDLRDKASFKEKVAFISTIDVT